MVGWGILGCGSIATNAIAPAMRWSHNGRLVAVASRERGVAETKARELGAVRAYAPYEAILDDAEVDAVYIGLPNGLHETWVLRAIEKGKHVLCEKSIALSAASASRMSLAAKARGVRLVEAFMYRHHPQWNVVSALLAERAVGEVRFVRAGFCGALANEDDHRWSAELGGGALFDVTCYAIDAARFITGREPIRVTALGDMHASGVDISTEVALELEGGILASASGSLGAAFEQHVSILGTEGRIEVERPFVPGWDGTHVVCQRGKERRVIEVGGANHFLHQIEHFARLVAEPKAPAFPAEDGLRNAVALEAVRASLAGDYGTSHSVLHFARWQSMRALA